MTSRKALSRPNSKYSRAVLVPRVSWDWPCVSPQKWTRRASFSTTRSGLLRHSSSAAVVEHAHRAIARIGDVQPLDHNRKATRREPQRRRQARDRSISFEAQRAIDEVRRIAPFVVGLDREAERLAGAHQRRQHRAPMHARARHDANFRALRQRHVVVGGDRVGEDAKLELALAIGLHANAGRALRRSPKRMVMVSPGARKSFITPM